MSHLSHPVQQARTAVRSESSHWQAPAWGAVFRRFTCLLPFLTSTLNFPWSRHGLMYPYPDELEQEGREKAAGSVPGDGMT